MNPSLLAALRLIEATAANLIAQGNPYPDDVQAALGEIAKALTIAQRNVR